MLSRSVYKSPIMLISKTDKSLWMPFDSAEDDPGFVSRFSFSVLLDREGGEARIKNQRAK